MGEIIIRYVQLPRRVKAVTATDENGDYNIYVNSLYNCDSQQKAIRHELVHIDGGHFHRPTDAASDEKEAEADVGKAELCHSERSEESHTHKSRTLPHSTCDTSRSATAQYDSTRVLICHSEAQCAEESHQHKCKTLPHSICDTSRSAIAQYDRVSEKSPQRTTVKVSRANIVPRPDFEKLRRRAGLTAAQAAKLAGISHTEYIKYECGLAPCPPLTAKAITAVLTGCKKQRVK